MTIDELNKVLARTLRATRFAPASRQGYLRAACRYLNKAKRWLARGDECLARMWLNAARVAVARARHV